MLTQATGRLQLRAVVPPEYRWGQSSSAWTLTKTAIPEGAVLLVELSADISIPHLADALGELALIFRGHPIGLAVESGAMETEIVVALLSRVTPRATVLYPSDPAPQLRLQLADPARATDEFLDWARRRWGSLGLAGPVLRQIASLPHTGQLSERLQPVTTLPWARRILADAGLPPLAALDRLARGLLAATRLQYSPCRSVHSVARELGYRSHGAVSHLFARYFDCSAKQVRQTIGSDWLAERYFPATSRKASGTSV